LIEYKTGIACARCGFSHPAAIQFHHRDTGLKKFEIGSAAALEKSIPQVIAEIEKCEVLCANCHLIHHYDERQELEAARQDEEAYYQELLEE
jgi:hypothetical protein